MPALTGQQIYEYGDLTFALLSPARCDTDPAQQRQPWVMRYGCYFHLKGTVSLGDQTHSDGLEQNPAPRSARWEFWIFPICTRHTGLILNRCNGVVSLCLPSGEAKYSSLDWKLKKKKKKKKALGHK